MLRWGGGRREEGGGRREEGGGRREEGGGRREEGGGRRKEEGGRRKEEGGRREEGRDGEDTEEAAQAMVRGQSQADLVASLEDDILQRLQGRSFRCRCQQQSSLCMV